jgi:site-specific recombinase XerD
MLNDLFKEADSQYRSLRLFGSVLDEFDDWLAEQGYAVVTRQDYVAQCAWIEKYFWKRKVRSMEELTPEKMRKCRQFFQRRAGKTYHAVTCMQRFLESRRLLSAIDPLGQLTPVDTVLSAYQRYLMEVRGFAPPTILAHCRSAAEFLRTVRNHGADFRSNDLTGQQIERFIVFVSRRLRRGTLQHVVAHIRSFLRFLVMRGEAPAGLDSQIDTPRSYRLEQLPKSLPWDTVCAFVESIHRTDVQGLRDYAMFMLIAAYGLRACDVAGLKLEDIDWRMGQISFKQHKTKHQLVLPLSEPVAEALLAYLRGGRPRTIYREIFMTLRAPISPISIHTIGGAFRSRVRRGKLPIPFEGVHCLRHSYAMHLLRQGASLKAIGDVLGHHSTESTCVYLRLDFEELRDVALPLPVCSKKEACK